jgi:hypothetical protein
MGRVLTRVTITGADDGVSPKDLAVLSVAYPFVEWGILFSMKRFGVARYPHPDWVGELLHVKEEDSPAPMKLAAHVCGSFAREIADGTRLRFDEGQDFDRVQLNGIPLGTPTLGETAARMAPQELILQAKSLDELAKVGTTPVSLWPRTMQVLLDASGGTGKEISDYPFQLPKNVCVGFAGGIGPDNVERILGEVTSAFPDRDFWIDMESGVRTDDVFDLEKVASVLKQAARFVKHEKGALEPW